MADLDKPVLVKLMGSHGIGGGKIVRTEEDLLNIVKDCLFRGRVDRENTLTLEIKEDYSGKDYFIFNEGVNEK